MPRDPNNLNHIIAPVGLATVAQVLGEAKTDTGTLCLSPKISPYSLIRPLFYRSDSPGTPPSLFASTDQDTSFTINCIPTAHKQRLFPTLSNGTADTINLANKTAEEYPCKNDYAFTGATYVYYGICKWGYAVPYVNTEDAIFALRDLLWERFYPADSAKDANGKPTECWCNDHQFDGYIHATEDDVPPPLKNVVIQYGEPISATPNVDVGNYTDAQVLGTAGQNHPGGIVSIPAVIGVGGTYGMTVYRKADGASKYSRIRSFVGGKITASGNGLTIINAMQISEYPASRADWIIIPWVAQGGTPTINATTGFLNIPSGTRIYGFRYAPQFQGYAAGTVVPKVITFGGIFVGGDICAISKVENGQWKCELHIYNAYRNYPLTATDFYLEIRYKESGNTGYTVKRFGVLNTAYGSTASGTVTSLQGKITYSSGTAVNGTLGVNLSSTTIGGIVCKVTMTFSTPYDANLTSDPELVRVAFMSEDENHTSVGKLRVAMVYTPSGTPLPVFSSEKPGFNAL